MQKTDRYERITEHLLYVCDDIIYPKMVSRLFGIDMKTTICAKQGRLVKAGLCVRNRDFILHCKQLAKIIILKTINSLPDSYCCEACGNEMNSPLEDVIVTYRKLRWYSFKES